MTDYAPAVVAEQARRAGWNPAPVVDAGNPEPVDVAEKPTRAADVGALIPKEIG